MINLKKDYTLQRYCVALALVSVVVGYGLHNACAAGLDDLLLVHPYSSVVENSKPLDHKVVGGKRVAKIVVKGNKRVESAAVIAYSGIKVGSYVNASVINMALKRIYATNLFSNVSLNMKAGEVNIAVEENPLINRIAFEGNHTVKSSLLSTDITLKNGQVFSRSKIVDDVTKILNIYKKQGRYNARVHPELIKLSSNRVDVIYNIEEGKETEVQAIHFIGNKFFSESELKSVINTKEDTWYRFLSSSPLYDHEKLTYDQELLRRFYYSHGFIDFQVKSSVAELTDNYSGFIVSFHVEEGARYKFGRIKVISDIPEVDVTALEHNNVTVKSGDWYNANDIQNDILSIKTALYLKGIPFSQINPEIERDEAHHVVSLVFHVENASPMYIERVRIHGNKVTNDKVIRRQLKFVEGDAYNQDIIDDSKRNVQNLGFFKNVTINATRGSTADKENIDLNVVEQPTASISLGGGYSTDAGILANLGYADSNFEGTGRSLSAQFQLGSYAKGASVSYFDPYFNDTDLSLGGSFFYKDNNYQRYASYNERSYGAMTSIGYSLSENVGQTLSYSLSRDSIYGLGNDASDVIKQEKGERILSTFGQSISYNTLDNFIWPTRGIKATWGTQLTGMPFFPHVQTLSNIVTLTGYHSILVPYLVGNLTLEAGYIESLNHKKVALQDRFMLGGQSLRGFAVGGVGARDLKTNDSLGGALYQRGSAEVVFPLGFPAEFGLYGAMFTDFGRVYNMPNKGPYIVRDKAWRQSVGVGLRWRSPMGFILKVDYARPVIKKTYDIAEEIQFNIVGSLG